mmetsp:Transcript_8905/g.18910  ORF Transcript_8905/g.18910 Transcript_8905/m.18910 type:complete len:108 (-) Transcript_8905:139-462(-)|eukprot:CAMPEP_0185849186 /NCGR_PEP_ID=MMETSP1354-20130828/3773_1 /TAXON_ID=708628 /ORGANISM="Erythrolobus madagascarensis, Strain CCMP3276" /LENGTH=107 /DNA_ID=CAMNT_0028549669 /DNA_START=50 /DNA_END=373 /DNA_ORIENTATION=+
MNMLNNLGGAVPGAAGGANKPSTDQADKTAKSVFDTFDKDKSGALDKKEVTAALQMAMEKLGMQPPSDAIVSKVIGFADKDRSGTIDLKEFSSLVGKLLAFAAPKAT